MTTPPDPDVSSRAGYLDGVRVLELADERGEYCGRLLAGLGADVVKVEPPGGEVTRTYGPFLEDRRDPDRSLHFWHYNLGKRAVVTDLDTTAGQERFRLLAADADVVLETRPKGYLDERGIGYPSLSRANAGIIFARITPFGDDGPWSDFAASDLIHLALGGVVMNCGYDPEPSGHYDTPPIAPQAWQAYQIAGEMAAVGILGALLHRLETGRGQQVDVSIHEAVSKNTEVDVPNWIYSRLPHFRQTGRHSRPDRDASVQAMTKDGRWILPYRTYLQSIQDGFERTVALLEKFGMAEDLRDPKYQDPLIQSSSTTRVYVDALIDRLISRFRYSKAVWRDAQQVGLTWAPIRKPEENLWDPHWRRRQTFVDIAHPEHGRSFAYVVGRWYCQEVPWRAGPRAPLLHEHDHADFRRAKSTIPGGTRSASSSPAISARGKPFAVNGVRMLDLCWLLASAGAGRFLAAAGAEVIRIEHRSRFDRMRFTNGLVPPGGRPEREAARAPIRVQPTGPNRGGYFMDINSGKRAISLNLKHPRGRNLLARLIPTADVIADGFSPGTINRMGFGYEQVRKLNPRIISASQSGMGEFGIYGDVRTFGPVAQAFSGLTEMSGLPEPYPPAGIGYSYLDWFGAYNLAIAIFAALYRQRVTGEGCRIDSSQVEIGLYLAGTALLDHSANRRISTRTGNGSPWRIAAPHGVYRTAGKDRWIAIACFTDENWKSLLGVLGNPGWGADARFATLAARDTASDELDRLVGETTERWDGFELMNALQNAGVPAGVCQTAEDRCESDPQLAHLQWLTELRQTEIGTWPAKEVPAHLSETPFYVGGLPSRHGPNYGEDNEYVYGELLGLSTREIAELRDDDII